MMEMPHWLFHSWGKWETIETHIGVYSWIHQKRVCSVCNAVQLREANC
jgi:hypothetical protein